MQLIRCTKKLQKEIGLKQSDLCTEEPRFSYLGSWHANLIHIDRRKCLLFANDRTLLPMKVLPTWKGKEYWQSMTKLVLPTPTAKAYSAR